MSGPEDIEISQDGVERSLQLRDHIDYQEVLRRQLLLLQNQFIQAEPYKVLNAVYSLEAQTPLSWYDKEFIEDLDKSEEIVELDVRPLCCGIPLSPEYCKAQNIPTVKKFKVINPFKRLSAIINLWDRKGYTTRRQIWEETFGIPYDKFVDILQQLGDIQKPES